MEPKVEICNSLGINIDHNSIKLGVHYTPRSLFAYYISLPTYLDQYDNSRIQVELISRGATECYGLFFFNNAADMIDRKEEIINRLNYEIQCIAYKFNVSVTVYAMKLNNDIKIESI